MTRRETLLLFLLGVCCATWVQGHSHGVSASDRALVQAYGPGYSALEDMTKRHLAVSERIDGRLARMEAKIVGGTVPPGAQDGLALLGQRCAGCHKGEAKKGGGHSFFTEQGALTELKPLERKVFVQAIEYQGDTRMPPAAKLADEEILAIKSYLLSKEQK